MWEYCGNCTGSLPKAADSSKNVVEPRNVRNALGAVFLHLPPKSTVDKVSGGRSEESNKGRTEDDWELCDRCGEVLIEMYKLYEEFVQLCKDQSIVFQRYVGVRGRSKLRSCGDRVGDGVSDFTNQGPAAAPSSYSRALKLNQRRTKHPVKLETPSDSGSTADDTNDSVQVFPPQNLKVELDYEESEDKGAYPLWDPEAEMGEDDVEEGLMEPFLIIPDKQKDDEIRMTSTGTAVKKKRGRPRKEVGISSLKAGTSPPKRGRPRVNKVHKCMECGKQAKSRWNLNMHIKSVHEKLRPFQCSFCLRSFFSKTNRKLHIQRFHSNHTGSGEVIENTEFMEASTELGNFNSSELKVRKRGRPRKSQKSLVEVEEYEETENDVESDDSEPSYELEQDHSSSSYSSVEGPIKKRGRPPKSPSAKANKCKIHKCPECGKEAKNSWNLNMHIRSVHEKLRPFKCNFCPRNFFAKSALNIHLQNFHHHLDVSKSINNIDESPPNKSTKAREVILQAAKNSSSTSKSDQALPVSEVKIPKKKGRPKKSAPAAVSKLKRGRGRPPKLPYEQTIADEKTYQCPACDKKAKSRWNLSLHIKCVHEKVKPFECLTCSKKFFSKYAYRIHNRRFHEGGPSSPFVCTEPGCGRNFAYPAGLHAHSYSHKPREDFPFTCDECGNKFKRSCDLLTHKARHSDERPFICDQCGSAFKTAQNLGKHMNSQHRNKNLATCQLCGKVLRNSWNLSLHIKSVHENRKPHQCHICGSAFSSSSNLKVHLRGVHAIGPSLKYVESNPEATSVEQSNVPNSSSIPTGPSAFHDPTPPNNSFTDLMTTFLCNQ